MTLKDITTVKVRITGKTEEDIKHAITTICEAIGPVRVHFSKPRQRWRGRWLAYGRLRFARLPIGGGWRK